MTPIEKIISIAEGELGYTEMPPHSNNTKYGQVYGLQGQPWCVIFLWWLFREAGLSSLFYDGQRTASCGTLLRWAKTNELTKNPNSIKPGDIVILNFSGTNDTEHCGLVTGVDPYPAADLYFKTIEGNTTPGEEGSQDNGGSVASKIRYSDQVVGIIRPKYTSFDYVGNWAEDDIRWGIDTGLIKGYEDGSVHPNDPMIRAEVITLLRRYDNYRFGGSNR